MSNVNKETKRKRETKKQKNIKKMNESNKYDFIKAKNNDNRAFSL